MFKNTINRAALRRALLAGASFTILAGAGFCGTVNAQTNVTIAPSITPGAFNNQVGATLVNGGITNLSGNTVFTGSSAANVIGYSLVDGYNAGYFTGSVDPSSTFRVLLGPQNNAVVVHDPITGGATTINAYSNSGISEQPPSGTSWGYVYFPSSAGAGPFVDARLVTVSNGGVLNFNVSGTIGNNTVKNTTFVYVDNGSANWNSNNVIVFSSNAAGVAPGSLAPYNQTVTTQIYAGNFSVMTSDGVQARTVNNLSDFQSYNNWLVLQLQAGKLGSGAGAQTNYNNAIALAYTSQSNIYTANPDPLSIPASDPIYIQPATRIGAQADGINAVIHVGITGGLSAYTWAATSVLLSAVNGGTIINDGTVTSFSGTQGMVGDTGARLINNGVRILGKSASGNIDASPDEVFGYGTTYTNNGTVNLQSWAYDTRTYNNYWLRVNNGAAGANNGAVNIGTITPSAGSGGVPIGVNINSGGSFSNTADGVMYIGRAASTDTTSAPMVRGGADVVQPNGGIAINVLSGGAARNDGTIIVGDLVQNGKAIQVVGTGVNVVNAGTIEVRGHYSASPATNVGIYSTSTSGTVNNSDTGIIDLTGVNVIGIQTKSGGKAQSSGTINVAGGADPSTGLRNYGIWSEGSGSLVTLSGTGIVPGSGTVNLSGNGAIGVHARSAGSIAISGDGKVVFSSGTSQIGYFAYGTGSTITNNGTGAQDVSTANSVLFRMEDGADFSGGTGATSVLTASGQASTAVVVTGVTGTDVSAFNSGGMTINATGQDAVAVLVEGGAQGKITSAATISLTGIGAIAGIADGQKHDLAGTASGAPVAGSFVAGSTAAAGAGAIFGTGTILVAGANLNSSLNSVIGYKALNGASLSNSGNITFSGTTTTGIQVLSGSTGGNSGNITQTGAHSTAIQVSEGSTGNNSGWIIIQDGSVGLVASSSGAVTTLNNTGNITLKGGSNADRTIGISATGTGVTVNMSAGLIDMQGQGAIGASAYNGAKVNLTGTASATFSTTATDQIMLLVSGAGSTVSTATSGGGTLDASGKNSTLIRLQDGATQSGVLNMSATGDGARGIWATGAGTKVTALSGSTFNVGGSNAQAVLVQGGAEVDLNAGTVVNLTGTNTIVGTVDGNEYALDGVTVLNTNTGSKLVSEATLNSTTAGATGFIAQNLGILTNNGSIDFSGANSQAVKVLNGTFVNTASISANGTAVYVQGAQSTVQNNGGAILATNGKAAVELGTGANLNLVGSGVNSVEGQGTAHAVLIGAGATGLNVDGAHLIVNAAGATGNGIENAGEIAGIKLTNTTVIDVMNGKGVRTATSLAATNAGTINIAGSGIGLAFQTASGGAMGNSVDLSTSSGLTINVNGAAGTGIDMKHTGGGTLNNAANVNVAAGGGSAMVLAGVTTLTNAGNLISASTAAVVDLGNATTVTNTGNIQAANASAAALTFDAQDSTLTNSGQITGIIDLGAGANVATNAAGATITGNIISATGDNTITNSGAITGNIALGNGTNSTTLNNSSSVVNVTGGTGVNNVTVKGTAAFTLLDGGLGGTTHDTLTFDGATHTLSATSDVDHFETMALINNSVITTADPIKMTDTANGVGAISIAGGSTLNLRPTAGYTLNHAMTGTGVISAVMGSGTGAFTFGAGAGNAFAGTLQMGTGTLALTGNNTTALTNATLRVDTGSVTTVGNATAADSNQTIGGLTFYGGTMKFIANLPAERAAQSIVTTTGVLDITGTGKVQVTVPAGFENVLPVMPATSTPLLEQDDGTIIVKLVTAAGSVVGTGGALSLVDQTGTAITNARTVNIDQGGTPKVAVGTYDFGMSSSADGITSDGLYVSYGLTQVGLIGTGSNALVLTPGTGATGLATDLSAKVVDFTPGTAGDLAIAAGAGNTVSLSNALNSYSGVTDVRSGTLKMAANNVLGATANLNIANGAFFDSAGFSQSIGQLNTAVGAKATIAAGSTVTITDAQRMGGSTSGGSLEANTLFGAGGFVIDPSILPVNGAQPGFTGLVQVTGGSQLLLNTANAFDNAAGIQLVTASDTVTFGDLSASNAAWTAIPNGSAAVKFTGLGIVQARDGADVTLAGDNSGFSGQFQALASSYLRADAQNHLGSAGVLATGTFNVIANSDWDMSNLVTGTGTVLKTGTGLLKVGDDSLKNFTGLTDIREGTLQIGQYAGDDAQIGGSVRIATGAQMGGTGVIVGNVENTGQITALNALAAYGGAGEVSDLTIRGTLTNSGIVQLGGTTVGNTLTVTSIVGNGGTFVLNTVLGDDSSLTDKIIVNGGTVTGSNFIAIVNQGGLGAQTTGNGIQVVVAQNGATTAAGTFALQGRAAAGAYEYNLVRGDLGGTGDSWFLRTPSQELPDTGGGDPDPTNGLRPEVPTNAAIMPLAAEFGYAMLGTLHERTGGAFVNSQPVYEDRMVWCKDPKTNFKCAARSPVQAAIDGQRWVAGGWARIFADRGEHSQKNFLRNGSDYDYTLGGAQIGLDVFANEQSDGTLDKAGIYVGYGQVTANIKGVNGGKAGTVDLNGTSAGAYWTHYAASGWYTDAVIQGTWYTTDAKSIKGEQIKPDGFGFMASLEGGYSFKLGSGWTLEPQAQVIYQTISFDNTQDHFGTFRFEDSDSVRARIGARLARTWNNGTETEPRMVSAWLRANVWHEFSGKYQMTTATFQNSDPFTSATTLGGTWGELGAGVTAQVADKVNLFATGAYQHSLDNKGRQGWNGRLGVTVKW